MATKIYWLYHNSKGAKLGMMARPRGNDWLGEEIAALKKQNVSILVSLLEKEEIVELDLLEQERICKKVQIEFINFPIKDCDVPEASIDKLINYLKDKLEAGYSVVVHCRMGIGRSSIIAACILLQTGNSSVDEIISQISNTRGLEVPDTKAQLAWIRSRQFR